MNADESGPPRFSLRAMLAFVAVLGVYFYLLYLCRPIDWNRAFQDATRPANRVVVEPIERSPWSDVLGDGTEFAGKDRVRELLAKIEIDQQASKYMCACSGDALIHFYEGQRHLLTLSHQHGTALRWLDGPWHSDGVLTPEAQQAFPQWFADNGYDAFAELKAQRP